MNLNHEAYRAWHFLWDHAALKDENNRSRFQECLDIHFARVDPKTKSVNNDPAKNTEVEIWLECGAWLTPKDLESQGEDPSHFPHGTAQHDYDLDCGGDTFEEAILELARLVFEHYGE